MQWLYRRSPIERLVDRQMRLAPRGALDVASSFGATRQIRHECGSEEEESSSKDEDPRQVQGL
jgi:hypothetical protein